jgi:hypothetical protein
LNREAIERARIRIDARKWTMSKIAPKKYGEKITQEQTGPNGEAIKHEHIHRVERVIVDPKN